MRASRLVQLLLLLQARGRMTAAALAEELEVSERTIHRDVDALSAAGVPIYAERGPHGGIQLVDGYRTRLTGLTTDEADAVLLSGLPDAAAELGLGTVLAAAQLKVLAALPPELRSRAALPTEMRARATRLVERFHLDAAGWFHATESVPHLARIANAVWEAQRITVGYRRAGGEVNRILDPLGIVLKAGIWYLVASAEGEVRTYRVSRFSRVSPTGMPFARPPDFDLAEHWRASIDAYEQAAPHTEVTLRIDPRRIGLLADLVGVRAVDAAQRIGDPSDDPDGWLVLRLEVDWPDEVPGRLLALGDAAELLEPAWVRERMVELAERVLGRHRVLS
jgi:predicted DNA-binding transcriptional regulator YafY